MALRNRFERISRGEKVHPLPYPPLGGAGEQGAATATARFLQVAPERIERDRDQPRKDLGDLEGLKASIKAEGILVPLIVAPLDEDRFRLVAGERRLTAARLLGLAEVPVLVRTVEEHQQLVVQILENLHRKDLTPVEEAQGVHRLLQESGLTQREVALRLGKSLTYVNELLRILDLPAAILDEVRDATRPPTKSVLLEIAKEPDAKRQRNIWRQAQSGGGLTVQRVRRAKRPGNAPVPRRQRPLEHGLGEQEAITAAAVPDSDSTPASSANEAVWSVRTRSGTVSVCRSDSRAPELTAKNVRQALVEALAVLSKDRFGRTGKP